VVVGVRPEHFAVADDGVPAEVVVVEPTGADTQIFCKLAASTSRRWCASATPFNPARRCASSRN